MREAILVLTAIGLVALAGFFGLVELTLAADSTGIAWVILILGALCTLLARRWRALLTWTCDQGVAVTLGLLGTVIGFMNALSGIAAGDDATKLEGVETALVTTIVGVIAHLWLIVVREVTRR